MISPLFKSGVYMAVNLVNLAEKLKLTAEEVTWIDDVVTRRAAGFFPTLWYRIGTLCQGSDRKVAEEILAARVQAVLERIFILEDNEIHLRCQRFAEFTMRHLIALRKQGKNIELQQLQPSVTTIPGNPNLNLHNLLRLAPFSNGRLL